MFLLRVTILHNMVFMDLHQVFFPNTEAIIERERERHAVKLERSLLIYHSWIFHFVYLSSLLILNIFSSCWNVP
jgi:hypothetical protein